MNFKSIVMIMLIVCFLLVGIFFVSSITGQAIRGETDHFSGAEFLIIIALVLLAVELIVISGKRNKKEVDIKELIRQAQEE